MYFTILSWIQIIKSIRNLHVYKRCSLVLFENHSRVMVLYQHAKGFYPRPVLAFGYCRCLRLCVCLSVCLSVCQSFACPRDNLGPVVLWTDRPWPPKSNLTWKSKFTPFELVRTFTHYPFKPGLPNLDQRWLRALLFWGAIDLDLPGQIWREKSNFQVLSYWKYTTTT